jgi:hypothetical protein
MIVDSDATPLTEVLAALGWSLESSPHRLVVVDTEGRRYGLTADDTWALLRRHGLITTTGSAVACDRCGYLTAYRLRGEAYTSTCRCWQAEDGWPGDERRVG